MATKASSTLVFIIQKQYAPLSIQNRDQSNHTP